jgi:hypothetical protein
MNKYTVIILTIILITLGSTIFLAHGKPYYSVYRKTVKKVQQNHPHLVEPGEIVDVFYSEQEEAIAFITEYWRVFIYTDTDEIGVNVIQQDIHASWYGYYEKGKIYETSYSETPGDE